MTSNYLDKREFSAKNQERYGFMMGIRIQGFISYQQLLGIGKNNIDQVQMPLRGIMRGHKQIKDDFVASFQHLFLMVPTK